MQNFSEDATFHKEQIPASSSKPRAKAVWGPSGYSGNKIKKTSEGAEKMAKSSSEHSSSGDVPLNLRASGQNSEETKKRFQVRYFLKIIR